MYPTRRAKWSPVLPSFKPCDLTIMIDLERLIHQDSNDTNITGVTNNLLIVLQSHYRGLAPLKSKKLWLNMALVPEENLLLLFCEMDIVLKHS